MARGYLILNMFACVALTEVIAAVDLNPVDALALEHGREIAVAEPSLQPLMPYGNVRDITYLQAASEQNQCESCQFTFVEEIDEENPEYDVPDAVKPRPALINQANIKVKDHMFPTTADNFLAAENRLPTVTYSPELTQGQVADLKPGSEVKHLSTPTISKRVIPPSGYATVSRPGMMTSVMPPAQSIASWSAVSAIASRAKSESLLASSMASALEHGSSTASQVVSISTPWVGLGSFAMAIASLVFAVYL